MKAEHVPKLSGPTSRLLDDYKRARRMPASARARVLEQLLESPADVGAAPPQRSPWLWAAVGGLAAALVLVAVAGVARIRGDEMSEAGAQTPMQAPAKAEQPAGARAQERAPESTASARRDPPASSGVQPDAPEARIVVPQPQPRVPPQTVARPRDAEGGRREPDQPPPVVTSTLAEENRLVSAAWKALASSDYAGAQRSIDEHARRFSSGVLAQEREAVAVIVACSQRRPGARDQAASFATAHPRSPLLGKIRRACTPVQKSSTGR